MPTAVDKARARGAGHEVVCVSHQLPVWTLRLRVTGKRLWHDPRRRQCGLASVTSLVYDGDRLVDVEYCEPAAHVDACERLGDRRGRCWRRLLPACSPAAPPGTTPSRRAAPSNSSRPAARPTSSTTRPTSRGRPGTAGRARPDGPRADAVAATDFAGKVVVINVWGQWCGPCRAEVAQLQQVYDATRGAGVAFLGIDVRDNNREAAQDFVNDRKVTFPSIYDPAMRTMIAFGGKYPTTVIPSTLVLDRQHRVAAVFLRELLADGPAARGAATGRRARPTPTGQRNDRVRPPRRRRTAAGGARGVRAGRAGVVRVAVRGAAGARLPVVSGRGGRRRRAAGRRVPSTRRRPRGGGSPDRRRCSSPGSPWCSCSAPSPCSA